MKNIFIVIILINLLKKMDDTILIFILCSLLFATLILIIFLCKNIIILSHKIGIINTEHNKNMKKLTSYSIAFITIVFSTLFIMNISIRQ